MFQVDNSRLGHAARQRLRSSASNPMTGHRNAAEIIMGEELADPNLCHSGFT